MIIYNVTVNIEEDVEQDWLQWMKQIHIPEVMKTGYFLDNKICKVLVEEEQGVTYAIQYTCMNMEDLQSYQQEHAPRLQKEHAERYKGKFVAFRTLLEVV
jgi:hypothetical protein